MKHGHLDNASLGEAVKGYLDFLVERGLSPKEETVAAADALDRVTARAVYACVDAPRCNVCAGEGVALAARASDGAAENAPVTLEEGAFVWVAEGDSLPAGCDAVATADDLTAWEDGKLRLYAPAAPWQHVRRMGEDLSLGDMILPSYETVEPASLGALLTGGVREILVLQKPRVGIVRMESGSASRENRPAQGDMGEINDAILSGMMEKWGASPAVYPVPGNDLTLVETALLKAAAECELVLLCGNTWAEGNVAADAIERLGEVKYRGIAVKPGQSAVLGAVGQTPAVGLPGYPLSAVVALTELVKPVIDALLMRPKEYPEHVCVSMGRPLPAREDQRTFVRATLGLGKDGILTAAPLPPEAGVATSLVKADCLLDVPESSAGYEAGDRASAILLKPIARVGSAVRIVGSHDPLLDEAADLLRRRDPNRFVVSLPAGSLDGAMAVARGEAHLGGVCLWDETDGNNDVSWLDPYIPEGGGALIACARRVCGLMVAKGNPKGIAALSDCRNPALTYVNWQRNGEIRERLDSLFKENGVGLDQLREHGRGQQTCSAAAAQIAGGAADWGVGTQGAAQRHGLDFIPVWTEQYALLASLSAMQNPAVQAYLQILQTQEFADRLRCLGGYALDQPGSIKKLWMARQ